MKKTKRDKIIGSINSLSEIERLDLLAELMKRFKTKNPMEFIQNTVCNELQISPVLLKSRSREQNIVFARQLTMYLARTTTDLSLETIGSHLGGRDHSTVLFACNKIEMLMSEKPAIKYLVHTLTEELKV
jgi:chromosomal replication initiator protein